MRISCSDICRPISSAVGLRSPSRPRAGRSPRGAPSPPGPIPSRERAGRTDPGQISEVFAELAADAVAWLDAENVPEAARRLRYEASLRYEHQGFELTVPWAGSEADGAIAG